MTQFGLLIISVSTIAVVVFNFFDRRRNQKQIISVMNNLSQLQNALLNLQTEFGIILNQLDNFKDKTEKKKKALNSSQKKKAEDAGFIKD